VSWAVTDTTGYPPAEFWAVIGDICEQAAAYWHDWPRDKAVNSIQLNRAEFEILRLAYVNDGGHP
jgi:hypothetical protein